MIRSAALVIALLVVHYKLSLFDAVRSTTRKRRRIIAKFGIWKTTCSVCKREKDEIVLRFVGLEGSGLPKYEVSRLTIEELVVRPLPEDVIKNWFVGKVAELHALSEQLKLMIN
jgi:hypothetical protein